MTELTPEQQASFDAIMAKKPKEPQLTPDQQASFDAIMAKKPKETGWLEQQAYLLITLSPIALGIGFLISRAIMIKTRPEAEREITRRKLGVWPRIMIVFSFFWSALVSVFCYVVRDVLFEPSQNPALFLFAFSPIIAVWLLYFTARWVRQGA